ncbi:MAG TPA: protein tyrosine phosphatase, partial [Legionellaceae bacterium]|nr:protein tyrosine phosphatase [Legionellaceae bacterium]
VIAVHNNHHFSSQDYLPGNNLASDARKLNLNHDQHYRNFFIVTQKKDFQRLKLLNFNSIWQSSSALDDGSLSIRLMKRSYINVEAGYDQLASQITMLKHA